MFLNGIVCSTSRFAVTDGSGSTPVCESSLAFVYTTLSVLGLIMQFALSLLFSSMMIDMNPFSSVSFASHSQGTCEMKFAVKFFLALYFAVDYQANLQVTLAIFLTVIYFIILIQGYFKPQYFNA